VVLRDSSDGNKTMAVSGGTQQCINLGSYNYLGFADDWDSTCRTDVLASAEAFPTSMCTSLAEGGYTSLHADVEACVASFLGKEAAAVFNMGWATNALGLPALLGGKGTLIVSDALNHNSIVSGARSSGAVVRVFRHNDLTGLKELLRAAIRDGQERTHRPWRKIVIAVEGIYSMEGEFCDLAGVVAIAKAHKCFVYLDEAHSIGATGATGRGVCEKAGVDPADVDVLMGTFTKSFGAMGGYIAGSRALVSMIKRRSGGFLVDNAMAPAVAQQVLTSLRVMSGRDGTTVGARKLAALQQNCRAFREGLKRLGVETLGEEGSPVVPMLVYHPTKLARFSRECLQRNVRGITVPRSAPLSALPPPSRVLTPFPPPPPPQLAVVVVGFPATPLVSCRARFCISAGHTPEDIARALVIIEEVVDLLKLRYKRSFLG